MPNDATGKVSWLIRDPNHWNKEPLWLLVGSGLHPFHHISIISHVFLNISRCSITLKKQSAWLWKKYTYDSQWMCHVSRWMTWQPNLHHMMPMLIRYVYFVPTKLSFKGTSCTPALFAACNVGTTRTTLQDLCHYVSDHDLGLSAISILNISEPLKKAVVWNTAKLAII